MVVYSTMRRSRWPLFNSSASSISLTIDHSHNISSFKFPDDYISGTFPCKLAVFVCHHCYAHDQARNPLCHVLSNKSSVPCIKQEILCDLNYMCTELLLGCGTYMRFILNTHLSRLAQTLSPTGQLILTAKFFFYNGSFTEGRRNQLQAN